MKVPISVLCLLLLCLIALVLADSTHEERIKRSPHHSKFKVKVVQRGPYGLRKHRYRYKGYGLGHYAGGYGYGGGLGQYGRGSSSSAVAFSSPFGSFAASSSSAGRRR